jgi:hypothetical protein
VRSPIRSRESGLNDCNVPCLPAKAGNWLAFFSCLPVSGGQSLPGGRQAFGDGPQAGVTFFGQPKKVTTEKMQLKENFIQQKRF